MTTADQPKKKKGVVVFIDAPPPHEIGELLIRSERGEAQGVEPEDVLARREVIEDEESLAREAQSGLEP